MNAPAHVRVGSGRIGSGLAAALGILACAPAVWALASLVPEDIDRATADFMVVPPELTTATRALIGAVSAVVVAGAAMVIARAGRRGALVPAWLVAVGLLAGVSAYAGLTYYAVTAPVIGANIGAGLLILAGVVAVPLALIGAVVAARVALRRPSGTGGPSPA